MDVHLYEKPTEHDISTKSQTDNKTVEDFSFTYDSNSEAFFGGNRDEAYSLKSNEKSRDGSFSRPMLSKKLSDM